MGGRHNNNRRWRKNGDEKNRHMAECRKAWAKAKRELEQERNGKSGRKVVVG
jgi:hypothetical protein